MYLLPEPKQLSVLGGSFTLPYYGVIVLEDSCSANDYQAAKCLQQEIRQSLGFQWEILRGNHAGEIIFTNRGGNPAGLPASLCAAEDKVEAYELQVTEEGVTLSGQSSIGLWNAVQTLRQLIRSEGAILPQLEVEDEPALANRGFYHDDTRGRIPTLENLKELVDTMAFYKMNQLQLYVEHTYLFRNLSEMWRDDTPLTAEEIMELDRYCRERHVELVPSLSSFGHLYKILSTKEYTDICELPGSHEAPFSFIGRMMHHTVDVTNGRSFQLVRSMMEEFMPLFTSKHFNLCADETFDLGTGRSKELGDQVGKQRLYMDFLKQTCQFVADSGRIPMFWGDIMLSFPEAVKELPENAICLNWGYDPDVSDDQVRKMAEVGATQYICPGVQGWNNLVNDINGAYDNISRMCSYAHRYGAIGVLNTDWGDYGHVNHPEFSRAGMIYGAAFSWNPQIPDRAVINEAISHLEYGDRSGTFVDLIASIYECCVYNWRYVVLFKEREQKIVVTDHPWFSMDGVQWEVIAQAEENLTKVEQQIYEILPQLDSSNRAKASAYLLAAEGVHIWNQIGQVVHQRMTRAEEGIATLNLHPDYPLAAKLEHWYRRYKDLWRTVSKESELYRVSEVIFWYADYLREC